MTITSVVSTLDKDGTKRTTYQFILEDNGNINVEEMTKYLYFIGTDNSEFTGREWKEDKYYDFYNINTCTVDKINANLYKNHALNREAGHSHGSFFFASF